MINKDYVSVCVTLLFNDEDELYNKVNVLKNKRYDIVEIRLDQYNDILNKDKVELLLRYIKKELNKPILLTIRSLSEGGYYNISDYEYYDIYRYMIEHNVVDYIDIEIMRDKINNYELIEYAHKYNIKVIMSYHNINNTNDIKDLIDYAHEMELLGADIIKIVTQPLCERDVITSINLSIQLSSSLLLPVIVISLSELGKITRVISKMMGSCMTYVSLEKNNNLGQIYIDDIYKYIEV